SRRARWGGALWREGTSVDCLAPPTPASAACPGPDGYPCASQTITPRRVPSLANRRCAACCPRSCKQATRWAADASQTASGRLVQRLSDCLLQRERLPRRVGSRPALLAQGRASQRFRAL